MWFPENLSRNLWSANAWNHISRVIWGQYEKPIEKPMLPSSGGSLSPIFNMSASAILFTRLAGISGALAVALGAYGSHVIRNKDYPENLKFAYETANRYHMIHTLALLAIPLTRRPLISGSLIGIGMLIFCGTCYYHALSGNTAVTRFTPYGGMLLIIGWFSMVF